MFKAPKFWYKKKDTYLSNSLYPFSLLFRFGTKIRNLISTEQLSALPIICIGNIVVGGAGKTPVSLKIGKLLIEAGYNPHFISKGYAGLIKKSTLVQSWHSATSVGDESILLSKVAPTWIGNDRIFSSKLAKKEGKTPVVALWIHCASCLQEISEKLIFLSQVASSPPRVAFHCFSPGRKEGSTGSWKPGLQDSARNFPDRNCPLYPLRCDTRNNSNR